MTCSGETSIFFKIDLLATDASHLRTANLLPQFLMDLPEIRPAGRCSSIALMMVFGGTRPVASIKR
jgi:hypothetical protein